MKLTQTLLGYLNRVFNKDPQQTLAIQFSYAGTNMSWVVAEKVLTVSVVGGIGAGFSVALESYTLASLAAYIASLNGFTVTALAPDLQLRALAASVLLDGTGNQNSSGGNNLYCYTSNLYSYYEAVADELNTAETAVVECIKQISILQEDQTPSAAGIWLDEIGGYYAVPRITGESDSSYGPRIISEVLRPRANNVALEAAIKAFTGQQTSVVDASVPSFSVPIFNAAQTFNGGNLYNSTGSFQYNIFDVSVGYDLLFGGDPTTFKNTVTAVVDRLRDAGTHMRSLLLTGSIVSDTLTPPEDGFGIITVAPTLADTLTAPTEGKLMGIGMIGFGDTLTAPNDNTNQNAIVYTTKFNSGRNFDGLVIYAGGLTGTGKIDGSATTYA
ncbi:MAG TPA: hypothetical protein DEQ40_08460 [Oxalobacteraceae bacterium]|jgi:hypothetical protein|nr:hypothetical protein [Oxalobacteraceae bacterium]